MRNYDVDIMNLQRAKALVPGTDLIEVRAGKRRLAQGRSRSIISTGARWRNINVPGEQEYRNKGVAYCPHCDGPLFKGKRVAVIGGGNSGVEAAIDLAGIVAHVTLIEFDTQAARRRGAAAQAAQPAQRRRCIAQRADHRDHRRRQKVNGLTYKDRATGEAHARGARRRVRADRPGAQHRLAQGHGRAVAGTARSWSMRKGQTSVPGVFAAGDATTVPFKQIIIAAGDGAKAALGAFDHLIRSTAPAGEPESCGAEITRENRHYASARRNNTCKAIPKSSSTCRRSSRTS